MGFNSAFKGLIVTLELGFVGIRTV